MISFDKKEIKESLNLDNIFELLQDWGGDPEYTSYGILSATICHNRPGEGSKKLYFYENSGLFRCYTGCDDTFDIFEPSEVKTYMYQGLYNALTVKARIFIGDVTKIEDIFEPIYNTCNQK